MTTLTATEIQVLHHDDEIGAVARLATQAGPESHAWLTVCRLVGERAAAAALALCTQTCESAPFFMWRSAVVQHAHVSDEDARRFGADLLHRRYDAGAMARDVVAELSRVVRRGLINERVERERGAAKHMLRVARGLT